MTQLEEEQRKIVLDDGISKVEQWLSECRSGAELLSVDVDDARSETGIVLYRTVSGLFKFDGKEHKFTYNLIDDQIYTDEKIQLAESYLMEEIYKRCYVEEAVCNAVDYSPNYKIKTKIIQIFEDEPMKELEYEYCLSEELLPVDMSDEELYQYAREIFDGENSNGTAIATFSFEGKVEKAEEQIVFEEFESDNIRADIYCEDGVLDLYKELNVKGDKSLWVFQYYYISGADADITNPTYEKSIRYIYDFEKCEKTDYYERKY